MPGMSGLEVCRRLKDDPALGATAVVILTARSQQEARDRAAEAGADAYLVKPFSPIELLRQVDHWTGQSGPSPDAPTSDAGA
jgi:CheY-like chemotaxis protein